MPESLVALRSTILGAWHGIGSEYQAAHIGGYFAFMILGSSLWATGDQSRPSASASQNAIS